ncbi:hypothetical protein ONV78_31600 [Hahella sp. CR1]|uniref:hypothetical protein n=1 Tax=Hahella sp. CR1 TaxID=2992807 RepID=UPI0024415B7D|nr:hypothetical protein [Hahella sp. CR1]MDG9672319.1 hypothetical protein [Hahella sp. CR1]
MNNEDTDISNILDAIIEGHIKRDEAEGVIEKLIFNGDGSSLCALGQAALDVIRYINYPELIIEGCASLSYFFRELDLIEWSQALRMKELYKKTNITCLSQIRMHQVVRQNYQKVDLGESRIDVTEEVLGVSSIRLKEDHDFLAQILLEHTSGAQACIISSARDGFRSSYLEYGNGFPLEVLGELVSVNRA